MSYSQLETNFKTNTSCLPAVLNLSTKCRALLRKCISKVQGLIIHRLFAAWHHFKTYKASRRLRGESAMLKMHLSRISALFTAWHAARLRAIYKRALLSRALAQMRHAVLRAAFSEWRQYTMLKSSLRGKAEAVRQHVQMRRKHVFLRAWHAEQQRAQHKKALLSRALAFMRHAVLPAAFQDWRRYSQAKHSRHDRAEAAMQQMQLVRKRAVLGAWHAAQLEEGYKRDLKRRALAHMRQALISAAFTAWAQKAACLSDARSKIHHCLQVSLQH